MLTVKAENKTVRSREYDMKSAGSCPEFLFSRDEATLYERVSVGRSVGWSVRWLVRP